MPVTGFSKLNLHAIRDPTNIEIRTSEKGESYRYREVMNEEVVDDGSE